MFGLIDGRTSLLALKDLAGMPEDEVVAILDHLCRQGVVALD